MKLSMVLSNGLRRNVVAGVMKDVVDHRLVK
jgi:hypothetical protein